MRKAIFAGVLVLVLGISTAVLADHGRGIVGWSHLADFDRSGSGHSAYGNAILGQVLSKMVAEGTLAQVQSDAIMAALEAKREELEQARQQTKDMLESLRDDDVLTEDEIRQLPMADQILAMEGVAEALEDGQITKEELKDLHPGKGWGNRGRGSGSHGRGHH